MKLPFQATHSKERHCSPIGSIEMSQFVDVIEIGKEKSISNKRAAEMLSSFITANSGNENDTFDENKIVGARKQSMMCSWTM